jgi:hypothetical protein
MVCSFCGKNPCESFFSNSYCVDCNKLRRMLLVYEEPKLLISILERCLLRSDKQIDNKIKVELKTKVYGDESFNIKKN